MLSLNYDRLREAELESRKIVNYYYSKKRNLFLEIESGDILLKDNYNAILKQYDHPEMFEDNLKAGWKGIHIAKKKMKKKSVVIQNIVDKPIVDNELLEKVKRLEEENNKLKQQLKELTNAKEKISNVIKLNSKIKFDEFKDEVQLSGIGTKYIKEQLKQYGFRWNYYEKYWTCKKDKLIVEFIKEA